MTVKPNVLHVPATLKSVHQAGDYERICAPSATNLCTATLTVTTAPFQLFLLGSCCVNRNANKKFETPAFSLRLEFLYTSSNSFIRRHLKKLGCQGNFNVYLPASQKILDQKLKGSKRALRTSH